MKFRVFLAVLMAAPFAHAELFRCRIELNDPVNQRLGIIDNLLDWEAERDHDIAKLYNYRITTSEPRPFARREELRYFMSKKAGLSWLDDGKKLLGELASKKKLKNNLSADERVLADGTLLFLRFEWLFEKADIKDEKNRRERIEIEHEIAVLEAVIDEKRAEIGQGPLPGRMFSDDHPLRLARDFEQSKALTDASRDHVTEIETLLRQLINENVYDASSVVLGAEPDYLAYWQTLGYPSAPY